MSKHRPPRGPGARQQGPRALSGSNYQVGYGKPPREHRFKPGRSGNPRGRPRGAKSTATVVSELLNRKLEVLSAAGVRRISVREAILTRHADAALKGDIKAATFLLQLEDQLKTKLVVREEVTLKTEEDVKAALVQRGLPESLLARLEFHDPKLLETDDEREE